MSIGPNPIEMSNNTSQIASILSSVKNFFFMLSYLLVASGDSTYPDICPLTGYEVNLIPRS